MSLDKNFCCHFKSLGFIVKERLDTLANRVQRCQITFSKMDKKGKRGKRKDRMSGMKVFLISCHSDVRVGENAILERSVCKLGYVKCAIPVMTIAIW